MVKIYDLDDLVDVAVEFTKMTVEIDEYNFCYKWNNMLFDDIMVLISEIEYFSNLDIDTTDFLQ